MDRRRGAHTDGPRRGAAPYRRRAWHALLAALVAVAAWAVVVQSAAADVGVAAYWGNTSTATGSTGGLFNAPRGVAVNNTTGDVYVADSANNRIQQFTAAGAFVRAWGWDVKTGAPTTFETCTVASTCKAGVTGGGAGQLASPQGVAINQTTGDVYVTDQNNRRVDQFTSTGTFVRAFGYGVGGVGTNVCTVTCAAAATGSAAAQFATTFSGYLAIAPTTGDVFVADPGNRRVQRFTSTGAFLSAFGWDVDPSGGTGQLETCTAVTTCQAGAAAGSGAGQFGSSSPSRLAVDATGNVYATDPGNGRVQWFDPTLTTASVFAASDLTSTSLPPTDVVADPLTGHVRVIKQFALSGRTERRILDFDGLGLLAGTTLTGAGIYSTSGAALTPTGRMYVSSSGVYASSTSNTVSAIQRIYVVDTVTPATATSSAATSITAHGATFNGVVNPQGGVSVGYHFEYSTNGEDWLTVPAADVDAGNGLVDVPVAQTVANLESDTEYRVRLVATKRFAGPTTRSGEVTFHTPPAAPEAIATGTAFPVRATTARLTGTVNANHQDAGFHFEYGTTTDYGTNVPATDARTTAGTPITVGQWATGLTPLTTYHYRLVVTSSYGTVYGDDETFTTNPAAVTPPPGRAYEMVTPPYKPQRRIGNYTPSDDTLPDVGSPSEDGDSLLYFNVFAVQGDPGGSTATDLARLVRTPTGWRPQSILDRPVNASGYAAFADIQGASRGQDTLSIQSYYGIMADQQGAAATNVSPFLYLRFLANPSPTWTEVPGWQRWGDPNVDGQSDQSGRAVITDDDRVAVVSSGYNGLLGPSDPSLATGSRSQYVVDLTTGHRDAVAACTGSGSTATLIPDRIGTGIDATDTIGTQPCAAGGMTSVNGSQLGGGATGFPGGDVARGTAANAVSEDGNRVFFLSPDPASPNALGSATISCADGADADTNCQPQLYVRQVDSHGVAHVAWISRSHVSGQEVAELGGGVVYEGASRDGSRVFFRTNAPLVADDPNGGASITTDAASPNSWDLYEYTLPADRDVDPADGTLTRITGGPSGTADPNAGTNRGTASVRYLSADGSRVYLTTAAPIAGADNTPPAGSAPGNVPGGTPDNTDTRNLYLYDATKSGAARWKFIALLPYAEGGLAGCAAANPSPGYQLMAGSTVAPIKASDNSCVFGAEQPSGGDLVAFLTDAQLTPDDDDSAYDVYAYDSRTDRLVRVSAPQGGDGGPPEDCDSAAALQCNAIFTWYDGLNELSRGLDGQRHLTVGTDGTVAFESRRRLVAADRNGRHSDVYQWKDGVLSLVSPGDSNDDAHLSGVSEDARDIFFTTSQPLSGWEIDPGDTDVYDARRGGGLPEPVVPSAPCEQTSTCQGAPPDAPTVPDGKSGGSGSGNEKAPAPRPVVRAVAPSTLSAAARKRLAAGGRVTLAVRVTGGGPVTVRLAGKLDGGTRVLASVTRTPRTTAATTVRVPLSLVAPARRALRAGRTIAVRLTVTAPSAKSSVRRITLKRAAPKRTTPTRTHG